MAGQQDQTGSGGTSNRGFGSMDEDKKREAARQGGQNVPDEKRGFSKDPGMASEAGRKAGEQRGSESKPSGGQQGQQGQQGQHGQHGQQGERQEQRGGSGNFAQDRERASEAGHKGGQH